MNLRRDYDAIVVGSGAAGGWAAKTLAESGVEVLDMQAHVGKIVDSGWKIVDEKGGANNP